MVPVGTANSGAIRIYFFYPNGPVNLDILPPTWINECST